jgi:hypothetical protein
MNSWFYFPKNTKFHEKLHSMIFQKSSTFVVNTAIWQLWHQHSAVKLKISAIA